VHDLAFHPFRNFLVTGSSDCMIRFFDFTKATSRRAFRVIREAFDVRSISMHPSGDFLLVAVDHPAVSFAHFFKYLFIFQDSFV
jgi:cleavage stimulation factor subunit 1